MILPNPITAIKALFRAAWFWITKHFIYVSEAKRLKRLDGCLRCEHYDEGQCAVCTCFVGFKVRLASEKCPKGKWR